SSCQEKGRACCQALPQTCFERSSLYAAPPSFSAMRTFVAFIGVWRMRTPVASKNAFAIAPAIAAVGGSPDPDSNQLWLKAAVLPLLTSVPGFESVVKSPGLTTTYSPG